MSLRRSCNLFLADDSPEDPVHQPTRLLRRVALGERDSFVDYDLEWDAALVELVDRQTKDVPLDRPEPVGRPAFRGGGDPAVELLDACGDRIGGVAGELVDLALVQRGERLAGHIPLIEQEEGGPAGGAATERHTSSSIARSTLLTSTPHICSSALATCP